MTMEMTVYLPFSGVQAKRWIINRRAMIARKRAAKQASAATKRAGYAKEQIKLIDAYGIATFGAVKRTTKPKATKVAPKQSSTEARIDAIEAKLGTILEMLSAK